MLGFYKDAGFATQFLPIQQFNGTGSQSGFALTAFLGSQLSSVYSVTSSVITKLVFGVDYTLSTNTINMTTAPGSGTDLYAVPLNSEFLAFGGTVFESVTSGTHFYLGNNDGIHAYSNLIVYSQDQRVTQNSVTQSGITFSSGVGSGFSGLTSSALVGWAVMHNGVYIGICTANTATTVTTDNTGYTNSTSASAFALTIGTLVYSLDNATWVPVLVLSPITSSTPIQVYVQDTVTIPGSAENMPFQQTACNYTESITP